MAHRLRRCMSTCHVLWGVEVEEEAIYLIVQNQMFLTIEVINFEEFVNLREDFKPGLFASFW